MLLSVRASTSLTSSLSSLSTSLFTYACLVSAASSSSFQACAKVSLLHTSQSIEPWTSDIVFCVLCLSSVYRIVSGIRLKPYSYGYPKHSRTNYGKGYNGTLRQHVGGMSEDKGEGKNEHEHEHDEKKTFDRHARLECLTGLPTQMLNPLHIEAGEGGGEARESVVDVQRAEHAQPVNRGSNAARRCCCSCGWRGPLVCVVWWRSRSLQSCTDLDLAH